MSKFDEAKALLEREELPFIVKTSDDNKIILAKLMFGNQDNVFVVKTVDGSDDLLILNYPLSVTITTDNGVNCKYSISDTTKVLDTLNDLATAAVETAKVAQTYMESYKWSRKWFAAFRRPIKEQG